jgi:hypothetical protein
MATQAKNASKSRRNVEGYERTRFNAVRHGILSRYTLLPWEDVDTYRNLLDALVAEHVPSGPTEEHLVEEVAGVIWRKRRLRMAEGAVLRRALTKIRSPEQETITAALIHSDVEKFARRNETQIASVRADRTMLARAKEFLGLGRAHAYEKALNTLDEQTRERWAEVSETRELELTPFVVEAHYEPNADGLLQFLENEMSANVRRQMELESKELIREQSIGEALKPCEFDGLVRYEIHLDRKLERMLTVLLRLKELRRGEDAP